MRLLSAGTPWSPALGPQQISGMQMCGVDTAAGVLSLTTAVLPWDLLTLRGVCRQRAVQAGSILKLICDLGAFRPSPFIIIRFKQKWVYCERGHVAMWGPGCTCLLLPPPLVHGEPPTAPATSPLPRNTSPASASTAGPA